MIDEYLTNGEVTYCYNVCKNGKVSKDMFKIKYNGKLFYLLCTFDSFKVISRLLIS